MSAVHPAGRIALFISGNWSRCWSCHLSPGLLENGHLAIFHVYFGGRLGGHLSIKSVLHLIVVVL